MLDYPALAAVAAVVREGTFERAALALGVTPSAVSQRVRGLEERVGAVLVVRGQPCRATEAGAELCAHVERVRLLEGEVAARLPALGADPSAAGPPALRVAVNADSLATWFVPAAAAFAADTGAVLEILREDEERTAERLRSGEVLAAVTADDAPVPGCRRLSLGALPYAAVASPAFAARHFPGGAGAEALRAAPLLRFDRSDRLQARWAAGAGAALDGAPTHFIPSTRGCVDAALLGLGWGMAPLALVAPLVAGGRLVDLDPGRPLLVPLHWQHARLGARLLSGLTRAVAVAARGTLVAPPPGASGPRRGGRADDTFHPPAPPL